jgi:O-antigen/teichoic acid export membrane protein
MRETFQEGVPLNSKKGWMRNPLERFHNCRGLIERARLCFAWGFAPRISCRAALAESGDVRLSSPQAACSPVAPPGRAGKFGSVYTYCETVLSGRLAKNASWMFLGQGLSFAVQACYFILLARLLGADEYGIFVGAAAAVSLLSQYSTLGSGMVMVRQVSRHNSDFPQYWGNVLITTLSVGLFVILALAAFGKWMVGPASASVIVLVAVGECTCARLSEVGGQAFQAFERLKLTAALSSLTNIARLVTAAGMMLVLRHATVRQWVIASLAVSCLSAAIALTLVTTRLGWPRFDFALLRQRALEGVGFSIAANTTSVYNDLDKAMLSRYGMLAANGIYSMAYRVVDMSCTPIRSLQAAALPRLCQMGRNGARSTIGFTRRLLGKTLPFGMLAAGVMFLAAPIIPYVVGRSFANSVSALQWLCLLPVFRSLHLGAGDTLTGAGYQRYRTASQLLAAGLNFGLNLWLIPAYSWHGAAWSSLVTDGTLAAGNWIVLGLLIRREKNTFLESEVAAI